MASPDPSTTRSWISTPESEADNKSHKLAQQFIATLGTGFTVLETAVIYQDAREGSIGCARMHADGDTGSVHHVCLVHLLGECKDQGHMVLPDVPPLPSDLGHRTEHQLPRAMTGSAVDLEDHIMLFSSSSIHCRDVIHKGYRWVGWFSFTDNGGRPKSTREQYNFPHYIPCVFISASVPVVLPHAHVHLVSYVSRSHLTLHFSKTVRTTVIG